MDSTFLHKLIDTYWKNTNPNGLKISAFILDDLCTDDEKRNIDYLWENTTAFDFLTFKYREYDIKDRAKEIINWLGFPIDLGSVIPQIQLIEIVKEWRKHKGYEDLNIILTGDGADEFFGGYKRNIEYDSRWYDIFIELIYFHNLKLDQISSKANIELRTPFQALPLLSFVLNLHYEARKNKRLFRELAKQICNFPDEVVSIKKHPLKVLPENIIEYRKILIKEFIKYVVHNQD